MKAWVLHDIGDIRYEDVDTPSLGDSEVLVEVKAAGICGSDIPRIFRDGAHCMPLIPGHEFSGQVVGTKDHRDDSWIGKRVGVFPLIPCKECIPCKQGQYEMCRNYSYLGSRRDGGFAQYVAVPQWNLIELPDSVSFKQAAMLEPMAVAAHAIRRMEVSESHVVAVLGLGTIGMAVLMLLLEKLGSSEPGRILAIGNKDFQRQTALDLGISEENFCDTTKEDVREWIMERTRGKGADVVFECVGLNATLAESVDVAAPGGKVMLVGNPHSDMTLSQSTYWKILRNQLQVMGTWNSSFTHHTDDDWHYVLDVIQSEAIHPEAFITHLLPIEELDKGLFIMRDKTENYGKIMVSISL